MAARDPKARSRNASIAANVSWALTPNRKARSSTGHKASPQSLEYWIAWAKTEHPDMRPVDRVKAAKNAYRGHMQGLAKKAVAARQAKRNATEAGAA